MQKDCGIDTWTPGIDELTPGIVRIWMWKGENIDTWVGLVPRIYTHTFTFIHTCRDEVTSWWKQDLGQRREKGCFGWHCSVIPVFVRQGDNDKSKYEARSELLRSQEVTCQSWGQIICWGFFFIVVNCLISECRFFGKFFQQEGKLEWILENKFESVSDTQTGIEREGQSGEHFRCGWLMLLWRDSERRSLPLQCKRWAQQRGATLS